jgi:2-methylcitrate dehydratase PrpD
MKVDKPDSDTDSRPLTRRGLLQNASLAIAAAAMAPKSAAAAASRGMEKKARPRMPVAAQTQEISSTMDRLSAYMSGARTRSLPEPVLERAEHHTLDTIAAMISGAELPPGRAAIQFASDYGGAQGATVPASTVLFGPMEAALVNGVMAHANETDDSWPSGWHPGCAVVPAALAAGENFGISGSHFLRAVALGYDVGSRVLITLRTAGPQTYKSTHSIAGVWGAAAAAGCAASLSPQQMRWLCDYTAQQASGIRAWSRDVDHIEKGFALGGMPARSGVTSALLVEAGWTGIEDIFSGENNYILANAREADPEDLPTELLIDELGERYEIARTNIKKWSVGSPLQAPLDAMEIILGRHRFQADDVTEVIYRGNPEAFTYWAQMPDINLRYMISVMLIDGTLTFESAHDGARMKDPDILRQYAKVKFVPGVGPAQGGEQPIIQVILADGTRFSEDFIAENTLGRIDNPMTRDQVAAKCQGLMAPVLGTAASRSLIDAMFGLEQVDDIRSLRPLLQRA